jgi:Zn-finger protein
MTKHTKKEHTWDYCGHCNYPFVRCGTCGMNCCSGSTGEINGEPCPDCNDAYEKQHEEPPNFSKKYIKQKENENKAFWDNCTSERSLKIKIKNQITYIINYFKYYKSTYKCIRDRVVLPFLRGLKGEFYCRWIHHNNQFAQLYSWGGHDWLHRKLNKHRPRYCQTCGNKWNTTRKTEDDPTGPTIEQQYCIQWKAQKSTEKQRNKMINKNCKHYPCHEKNELENCLLCFCPIYPCENNKLGHFIKNESQTKVWDCSNCTLFHKDHVAKKILEIANMFNMSDESDESDESDK